MYFCACASGERAKKRAKVQLFSQLCKFFSKKCENICVYQKKAVILHPLFRRKGLVYVNPPCELGRLALPPLRLKHRFASVLIGNKKAHIGT